MPNTRRDPPPLPPATRRHGRRATHEELFGRPEKLPLETLRYELRPSLVRLLAHAHYDAGLCNGMRFSYYGRKRLEVEANRRRILRMMIRAQGGTGVGLEEVAHVLAGDRLPPRQRVAQEFIRRAAVLCEAARQLGRPGEPTKPESIESYLDFLSNGTTLWSRFIGRSREHLLEIHRGSVTVPEPVARLYEWIGDDDLVAEEPFLRTAALYWGLSLLYPHLSSRPAVDAIVDHELRAGGIDQDGLFVIGDYDAGREAIRLGDVVSTADSTGNLTGYFEHFTLALAKALGEHHSRLRAVQDNEDRLPWLTVRPPDQLDRQIFDVIERCGSVTGQDLLRQLTDPPPLRTLQRRLQRLGRDGFVTKHGARKFAYYRLTERG